MTKIVLSYSVEDKNIAINLVKKLQKESLDIWIDYANINGGDRILDKIGEAIKRCDALILLWSKSAAESDYVYLELSSAFARGKRIIPCVIDNENLPVMLSGIHYIDFADFECGYNCLLKSLRNKIKNYEAPISNIVFSKQEEYIFQS
jgi:hypothetical protein